MFLLLVSPIWEKAAKTDGPESKAGDKIIVNAFEAFSSTDAVKYNQPTYYIGILAIVAALIAFYSIMKFKNRILQLRLGAINGLIMSLSIGAMFYAIHKAKDLQFQDFDESYKIGFFLPVIAIICNLLANRFIKKDEALVRSVDRIR